MSPSPQTRPAEINASSDPSAVAGRFDWPLLGWLCLAVLLCALLGSFHLGRASLWTDEVFARYYDDVFGLHFMLGAGLNIEPTPPTHAILLRGWIALFGATEAALRSLSLVSYVVCVPIVYALARLLGGRSEALLAAFLFAVCPFGLYFSQEARTYALTLAPATLVLLACAMMLQARRAGAASALYVAAGTLCIYLHATLVFFMAATALVVTVAFLVGPHANKKRAITRFAASNAIVVLLTLPYTLHLLTASSLGGLDWIGPLHVHDVADIVANLATGMLTPNPWPGFLLAALFFGTLAASVLRKSPPVTSLVTVIAVPTLFFAMLIVVSLARPILLPRVMCWTIIPLCILTARQIILDTRMRALLLVALCAAFGTGLYTQETVPNGGKEDWRGAIAALTPALEQADLVALSPRFDPLVLDYYGPPLHSVRIWDEHQPATVMTEVARRKGLNAISRAQLRSTIAAGRRVVVIVNSIDTPFLAQLETGLDTPITHTWNCGYTPCITAAQWGFGAVKASVAARSALGLPSTKVSN